MLLGVAQHLFTRFVDRRAETVLNSLPSKDSPIPAPERPAPATDRTSQEAAATSTTS